MSRGFFCRNEGCDVWIFAVFANYPCFFWPFRPFACPLAGRAGEWTKRLERGFPYILGLFCKKYSYILWFDKLRAENVVLCTWREAVHADHRHKRVI